jgi:hypothetical protein
MGFKKIGSVAFIYPSLCPFPWLFTVRILVLTNCRIRHEKPTRPQVPSFLGNLPRNVPAAKIRDHFVPWGLSVGKTQDGCRQWRCWVAGRIERVNEVSHFKVCQFPVSISLQILAGCDGGVQNYCVCGLCRSSGVLKPRKHNVSETESVSILMWREGDTTLLGPLERANLNDWEIHPMHWFLMDLVCWLRLLHKMFISLFLLVSGLCMLYHTLCCTFSCFLPSTKPDLMYL